MAYGYYFAVGVATLLLGLWLTDEGQSLKEKASVGVIIVSIALMVYGLVMAVTQLASSCGT